jgi:hypothetical protein
LQQQVDFIQDVADPVFVFSVTTTTDEKKASNNNASEVVKLTVKRARPKAASPNRQGPQQCQVKNACIRRA